MQGEENVSAISEEPSESNSMTRSSPPSQHQRPITSKFRGVVPLPNGNWGSQIYADNRRIWLGTFNSEISAAMAYDSAALKLRTADHRRNFPSSLNEPIFQSNFSTEATINMIKDGTYPFKLAAFATAQMQSNLESELLGSNKRVTCTQLFQKELTPSDVGKLNRLVIPKKFAVKFFGGNSGGLLTFADKSMKLWKFRFCYWKSSHTYVFTRGWSGFVKEKKLKAFDVVVFSLCECWDGENVAQSYYMIDALNGNGNGEEEKKVGNGGNRKSFRLFGADIA